MTLSTDINEQFARQRSAGWDRAEYQGRDGLDTTLGQAALYTTTPAWHGLGNVVPGGTSDVDEVLQLGGIDFAVELREARYGFNGEIRSVPNEYVTVRDDTGDPLGIVGSRYTPIQNRAAFTFLQDLVGQFDVTWESAGATRGGRNVFVSLRLPDTITVDAGGIGDQIVPFIAAINSHDGTSPFRVVVTPWRPVCRNTERFAVQDAHSRWSIRHTPSATDRIREARRTLGLSMKYYEKFADEETALARTPISTDDFEKLIADLWPVNDDASKRAVTNAEKRSTALHQLLATESGRIGRTAYAAERAITGYLDNLAPIRPPKNLSEELARATRVIEGADDDRKTAAHKHLMTRTR